MKQLNVKWLKAEGPLTIWSHGAAEMIPERFRRIVTVVLPITYLLLMLFGFTASIVPVPTFALLVGTYYGSMWALLVGLAAMVSLIGIIFRLRVEIYSSIILTILLAIYPFYVTYIVFFPAVEPSHVMFQGVFGVPVSQDFTRLAVIFSVTLYPLFPGWRVWDIVTEIRKSRQRQLYAEAALGGS